MHQYTDRFHKGKQFHFMGTEASWLDVCGCVFWMATLRSNYPSCYIKCKNCLGTGLAPIPHMEIYVNGTD